MEQFLCLAWNWPTRQTEIITGLQAILQQARLKIWRQIGTCVKFMT
jgi:hypothetical protein